MILVLLGTQDKPFNRLLEAIEKEIKNGNIKEKIIVQVGCTKYESKNMEIFDLIPSDELTKLISEANLVITHGGVGSILDSLKQDKVVIAAARLKEYGEHVNNHQLQIIKEFSDNGYILSLNNFDDLDKVLGKVKAFKPKKYISNTKNMVNLIENFIDNLK